MRRAWSWGRFSTEPFPVWPAWSWSKLVSELLPLAFVTFVATVFRLTELMDVPPGFHGDEGLVGIETERILREGWVGTWVPSALGTVTGAFYWTAAVFRIFGDSSHSVRLSFALLGIATVPITYLAFRVMYDRRVALLASTILAVMFWHVHFSRVAFVPVTWPLMEMATLLFLFAGFRTGRLPFFAVAGLAFGGGLYGYLLYPFFMVGLGVYLLGLALTAYRHRLPEFARQMAVFAACAVVIAMPFIELLSRSDSPYWDRLQTYSINKSPEYQSADGLLEKVDLFGGRARTYYRGFVNSPPIDYADATGIKPIFDKVSPFLIALGVVIAITRWRRHQYVLPLVMLIVVPVAALTSVDGMYRRTLGLAPFMALLAALPLARIWELADEVKLWRARLPSYLLVTGIIALVALFNYNLYFDTMRNAPESKWIFAREIAEASSYVDGLEENPYVYFFSARWSFNYETRQYLAPDATGEDRSLEFTPNHAFTLDGIDRSRDVVLLFLPPYESRLSEAMALYPGGCAVQKADPNGAVLFTAYHLSPGSRPGCPAVEQLSTASLGPEVFEGNDSPGLVRGFPLEENVRARAIGSVDQLDLMDPRSDR
jgi:Dolichyl-phosphate-mannose-protein mannosyltransferase